MTKAPDTVVCSSRYLVEFCHSIVHLYCQNGSKPSQRTWLLFFFFFGQLARGFDCVPFSWIGMLYEQMRHVDHDSNIFSEAKTHKFQPHFSKRKFCTTWSRLSSLQLEAAVCHGVFARVDFRFLVFLAKESMLHGFILSIFSLSTHKMWNIHLIKNVYLVLVIKLSGNLLILL